MPEGDTIFRTARALAGEAVRHSGSTYDAQACEHFLARFVASPLGFPMRRQAEAG